MERAPASRWKLWHPVPVFALATAAVLALAIGIVRRTDQMPGTLLLPGCQPTERQQIARRGCRERIGVVVARIDRQRPERPGLAEFRPAQAVDGL